MISTSASIDARSEIASFDGVYLRKGFPLTKRIRSFDN